MMIRKTRQQIWLRHFSKLTCFFTLFLIFVGGLVTSTGSGLAVPDWPLSYGTLFPPMVGGIFYEHGHRMVASFVGLLTLILAIWLGCVESRLWVRNLGFFALGAVITQGLLGGITVLFFLPTPVSVAHGVLAQTFFILTIILAYSQSKEREDRCMTREAFPEQSVLNWGFAFVVSIYIQLIFGAIMRHTGSGLAIPDFPTMGGVFFPKFDAQMLSLINDWRFEANWDPVNQQQVFFHFLHRVGAGIVFLILLGLNYQVVRYCRGQKKILYSLYILNIIIMIQITLGIMTVLSWKEPFMTSFHVVNGAALLGMGVLFLLRLCPVSRKDLKMIFNN